MFEHKHIGRVMRYGSKLCLPADLAHLQTVDLAAHLSELIVLNCDEG